MGLITPPLDEPAVQAFARQINPDAVLMKVPMAIEEQTFPLGNCYWNVAEVVKHWGGHICTGWLFHWLPGRYIEAMHHAVWWGPQEQIIDFTDKYASARSSDHSIFLPDDRLPISLQKLNNHTSRFFEISLMDGFTAYLEAYNAANVAEKELADTLWQLGYRCEVQLALAAGKEPQMPNLNVPQHITQRHLETQQRLGVLFRAIHDGPVAQTGSYTPWQWRI